MTTTRLICPVHGVIKEFDYDTCHIGDPLDGFEFCPRCGKPLTRKTDPGFIYKWTSLKTSGNDYNGS
jgi:hypothetical protein